MKKIQYIFVSLILLGSFFACTDNTNQIADLEGTTITKVYPTSVVTNQKIYIVGKNFDNVTEVVLPGNISVTNFERAGFNQISVITPEGMKSGYITLKAGEKEFKSPTPVSAVVPSFTKLFPDSVLRGEVLTIKGENLLEIKQVVFRGNIIIDALNFKRKSETEIQITIPVGTAAGKATLKMITLSGSEISLPDIVTTVPVVVGPAPLSYVFYEDAMMNSWQNWGWGSTVDLANTEKFRVGSKTIKATFTGSWGAIKFANSSVATSTYTELAFSVYGGPGTDGKKLTVQPTGGSAYSAVIKDGAWVDFVIPLSTLGDVNPIKELMLQETGWSGFVYIDHVGLR